MKEQELYDLLKDQQDLLVNINQRLDQIDKYGAEQNNFSAKLNIVGKVLGDLQNHLAVGDVKELLKRQIASESNLLTVIREQNEVHCKLIKEMPKKVKVNVEHNLTGKKRPYAVAGISLLLATLSSIFCSVWLWRTNNELSDGSVKIRMVRLTYPNVWIDIDTLYHDNPERAQKWVKQEEERLIAIKKAEELAKRSNEDAERAELELKRLRQQNK